MKYLDLKRIRKERKISQTELAKQLDYPQAYVSQIENRKRYAPQAFVNRVVEVLQMDNIDEYLVDAPKKVIIHEDTAAGMDLDNVPVSDAQPDRSIEERLVGIIERCHEIIREKDLEIARLRKALGEKYRELAEVMMEKKENSGAL